MTPLNSGIWTAEILSTVKLFPLLHPQFSFKHSAEERVHISNSYLLVVPVPLHGISNPLRYISTL